MYFILANHFLYKTISFNPNQNTHTHTHTHTYLKNQYGRLLYFPFYAESNEYKDLHSENQSELSKLKLCTIVYMMLFQHSK